MDKLKNGQCYRDAHPKGHGLIKGKVELSEIP
jgi:hypothetical protein